MKRIPAWIKAAEWIFQQWNLQETERRQNGQGAVEIGVEALRDLRKAYLSWYRKWLKDNR
jgi:hypothetical protein